MSREGTNICKKSVLPGEEIFAFCAKGENRILEAEGREEYGFQTEI